MFLFCIFWLFNLKRGWFDSHEKNGSIFPKRVRECHIYSNVNVRPLLSPHLLWLFLGSFSLSQWDLSNPIFIFFTWHSNFPPTKPRIIFEKNYPLRITWRQLGVVLDPQRSWKPPHPAVHCSRQSGGPGSKHWSETNNTRASQMLRENPRAPHPVVAVISSLAFFFF